ncbi:MAG: hypothetical protein HRU19_25505 [Pseudobacteriovorax sp.]|nr:hypothetical protein [Pseudobacteriovorax sp.]
MQFLRFILISSILMSCSDNLIPLNESPSNDRDRLELAETYLNERDYPKALEVLQNVEVDSNRARVLTVAATLGGVGFSIWDIILDVIDNQSSGEKISPDNFFDSLSTSVFGEDTKAERIAAIGSSIDLLLAAPDSSDADVANLNCFLGGILGVVSVEDGSAAITSVSSSLTTIQNSAVGAGASRDECPGVTELETSLATLSEVQTNLQRVFASTANCSLVNTDGSSLNSIETKLKALETNGDQGCEAQPDCGDSAACQAQSLSCVSAIVVDDSSVAGDGQVSSCELVQNCLGNNCF